MKLKDLMPEKVLNMDSIVWLQTASRAGGLNHLQFQEFLKSVDANYGDIICLSEKKKMLSGPNVERILLFVVCCQAIYDWRQNQNLCQSLMKTSLQIFHFQWILPLIQWVENLSLRWKRIYQCNLSNHANVPTETKIMANLN